MKERRMEFLTCQSEFSLTVGDTLFDCARRRVAGLRQNCVLEWLPFFVQHLQRLLGPWIHELPRELAELAVLGLIVGRISQRVLVAQRLGNGVEHARQVALEAREERLASSLLRKR